jgi:Uma2 family endonuclease
MSASVLTPPSNSPRPLAARTLADIVDSLDGIPIHRIRFDPIPGTATEADCVRVTEQGHPCELIDGTLVEKTMGVAESFTASLLAQFLGSFIRIQKLGITSSPDGMYRMIHGNIREPDFSFTRKERVRSTGASVGQWCPDLCAEILSPSNTLSEMTRKRKEYFASGCQLVWEFDLRNRTVAVYSSADRADQILGPADTLLGDPLIPGFQLPLRDLFEEVERYFPHFGS